MDPPKQIGGEDKIKMDTGEINCWVSQNKNPLSQTVSDWPNRFKVAFQKKGTHTDISTRLS